MRDGLGLLVGVVGMDSCGRRVWLRLWYRAYRMVSGSVCRKWERVEGFVGRDGGEDKKRSCEAEVWERARVLRRSRAHADGCGCGLVHTVVTQRPVVGHSFGVFGIPRWWVVGGVVAWSRRGRGSIGREQNKEKEDRRTCSRWGWGKLREVEVAVMCCTTRLWLAVGQVCRDCV